MLDNDFLIRMIKQYVIFLARILKIEGAYNYPAALLLIDETMLRFLGISSKKLNKLDDEKLLKLIMDGESYNKDKCIVCASLLVEEAKIYEKMYMPEEYYPRYLKALLILLKSHLYEYRLDKHQFLSVSDIFKKADIFELPDNIYLLMSQYYEDAGAYSKAEDMLYNVFEKNKDKSAVQKISDFYLRMLQISDEALVNGNLPRQEVLQGINDLKNYN